MKSNLICSLVLCSGKPWGQVGCQSRGSDWWETGKGGRCLSWCSCWDQPGLTSATPQNPAHSEAHLWSGHPGIAALASSFTHKLAVDCLKHRVQTGAPSHTSQRHTAHLAQHTGQHWHCLYPRIYACSTLKGWLCWWDLKVSQTQHIIPIHVLMVFALFFHKLVAKILMVGWSSPSNLAARTLVCKSATLHSWLVRGNYILKYLLLIIGIPAFSYAQCCWPGCDWSSCPRKVFLTLEHF